VFRVPRFGFERFPEKGYSLNFLSLGNDTQKRFSNQQENAQKYFVRFDVYFEPLIRDMEIARPNQQNGLQKA
jgi:hypothetical protein